MLTTDGLLTVNSFQELIKVYVRDRHSFVLQKFKYDNLCKMESKRELTLPFSMTEDFAHMRVIYSNLRNGSQARTKTEYCECI
jgi:hypothetical protein